MADAAEAPGAGRLHVPPHAALLLVDVQRGFLTPATREIVPLIGSFLDDHAGDFELVLASRFCNGPDSPCRRLLAFGGVSGPPDTDLCEGVERPGMIVLHKTTYALGEPLGELLAEHSIQRLFLAGMDTHACVLHEALDAFDRGIRPVVIEELCASGDGAEAHRCALHVLRQSVGVQNVIGLHGRQVQV
jgi:nicotinamidase-related amidase